MERKNKRESRPGNEVESYRPASAERTRDTRKSDFLAERRDFDRPSDPRARDRDRAEAEL